MSSTAASDYLTKQLFIENLIVTYRSLSRALSIHVNTAKEELAKFHSSNKPKSFATFLVCGDAPPHARPGRTVGTDDDDGMDVDDAAANEGGGAEEGEEVPEMCMIIVPEEKLDEAKSRLANVSHTHVYALSPSPIRNPGLLSSPLPNVYSADAAGGAKLAETVGRVVCSGITIPKVTTKGNAKAVPAATASASAKPKAPSLKQPSLKAPTEDKKPAGDGKLAEKPKPTGKLDFSSVKSKEQSRAGDKKEEKKEAPRKAEPLKKEGSTSAMKIGPPKKSAPSKESTIKKETPQVEVGTESTGETSKRGTKRKTEAWLLSSEDEGTGMSDRTRDSASPPPAVTSRPTRVIKRGVVLSDESEDDVPSTKKTSTKGKGKQRPVLSDEDEDLKAMMELDDDQVVNARPRRGTTPPETDDDRTTDIDRDEEMAMEEDSDDIPKPKRKRKEKKVVPLGKNGLRKRRVVKSRTSVDAKGFMVTEDYSEYESVDEEEPEVVPEPKKGARGKKANSEKDRPEAKEVPKPKIKPNDPPRRTESGGLGKTASGGQKNLMNFFGKPVKK